MKKSTKQKNEQRYIRVQAIVIVVILLLRFVVSTDFVTDRLRAIFEPVSLFVNSVTARETDDWSAPVLKSLEEESTVRRDTSSVDAQVININTLGYTKEAVISVGSDDGVAQGDVVVVGQVLVGVVSAAYDGSSDVRLVGDPNLKIPATVEGLDDEAIVRADIGGATLSNLATFEQPIRDRSVITSGLDGTIASGYILGSVGDRIESNSPIEQYVVNLPFRYSQIETVEVIIE